MSGSFLQRYLVAVQMHTRMPIGGNWALPPGEPLPAFASTAPHLPGVGWLIGIVACAVFVGLSLLLPQTGFGALAAAVGCTAVSVLMTGAAHEEGLAEFADLGEEIGERMGPGQIPPIRRERGIGHAGVLAVVLVLVFKLALLAVLAGHSPGLVVASLLAAHVVSRFWPILLLRSADGLPLHLGPKRLLIGAGWCVPAIAVLAYFHGWGLLACALAFSALPLAGLWWLTARRLRSFAVDTLGTAQQLCELGFYFGAAVALARG